MGPAQAGGHEVAMARDPLRMVHTTRGPAADHVDSDREQLVAELQRLHVELEMERDRRIAAELLARLSTVALEQLQSRNRRPTSATAPDEIAASEIAPRTGKRSRRLRGNWLDPEMLDRFAAD
jgi:hypothetical protein